MLENWKLPEYKTIRYKLNTTTNTFQVNFKPEGFNKIPDEVENIFNPEGKDNFYPFWHFGNSHFKPKKKGFIVYRFSSDGNELTCYFFDNYMPPSNMAQYVATLATELIIEKEKSSH